MIIRKLINKEDGFEGERVYVVLFGVFLLLGFVVINLLLP